MMAKRMKRTLALALSLVMVLGLLPAAAFAARVEDEYDSTAQIVDAGGTRYFKKDGNGVAETTKEAGRRHPGDYQECGRDPGGE